MLKKGAPRKWGTKQAKAIKASKKLLTSDKCLTHLDSTLNKLTLACDASEYRLGAVLSHKMSDESERPIEYVSCTLSPSEHNYSQLEKEALSCIFGIKRFHDYLFGRLFEFIMDHKPLLGLLKEDCPVSPQEVVTFSVQL